MRGGNIAGTAAPRLVFVWEGLIAHPPKETVMLTVGRRAGKTKRMVDSYTTDSVMAAQLWRLQWNHGFTLDLATFLGNIAAHLVKERVDIERLPFGWVTAETPQSLALRAVSEPNLARIYLGHIGVSALMFGSKGRTVTDPRVEDFLR